MNGLNHLGLVDGVSQGFDVYHRKSDPETLGYDYQTASTGGGYGGA